MTGDEDTHSSIHCQRPEKLAHFTDPSRVETVRRLIEYKQARAAEERLRDAEPLPHAKRVGPYTIIQTVLQLDQSAYA